MVWSAFRAGVRMLRYIITIFCTVTFASFQPFLTVPSHSHKIKGPLRLRELFHHRVLRAQDRARLPPGEFSLLPPISGKFHRPTLSQRRQQLHHGVFLGSEHPKQGDGKG